MGITHELTHVVLNGFRVDGVCFLNCTPTETEGTLKNNYTPFGVYLTEPKMSLAENETIAGGIGIIAFAIIMFTGSSLLGRKYNEKVKL